MVSTTQRDRRNMGEKASKEEAKEGMLQLQKKSKVHLKTQRGGQKENRWEKENKFDIAESNLGKGAQLVWTNFLPLSSQVRRTSPSAKLKSGRLCTVI